MGYPLLHKRSYYPNDGTFYTAMRLRFKALCDDFTDKLAYNLCSEHYDELLCLLFRLRYLNIELGAMELVEMTNGSPYGYIFNNFSYNVSYNDTIGDEHGVMDGTNKEFTVSEGTYRPGSLKVFREGQLYWKDNGILETDPENGVFTFEDYAPEATDQVYASYEVGDLAREFNNTYVDAVSFNPINGTLYLERNGAVTLTVDLSRYVDLFIDGFRVKKGDDNSDLDEIEIGDRIVGWLDDEYLAGIVKALPYSDPDNIQKVLTGKPLF